MQNKDNMHPQDLRNLIVFMAVSLLLWLAYDNFILKPKMESVREAQKVAAQQAATVSKEDMEADRPRIDVIAETARVTIDSPHLSGSINLIGARIDDLSFKDYFKTVEHKENVVLLAPSGTAHPRYIESGWVPATQDEAVNLPDKETVWRISGANKTLTPGNPVAVSWNNGQGLVFQRTYELDDDFGLTITQSITNKSGKAVTLLPYSLVAQQGIPENFQGRYVVHEGPVGYIGGELVERSYKDMAKKPREVYEGDTGWIGITDKYWIAALVPDEKEKTTYRFAYAPAKTPKGKERYQTDMTGPARAIASGATAEYSARLFAGVKKIEILEQYQKEWNIPHFDLAVDFGIYYFLTRPFFFVINLFYNWVGNFGLAIIMFTVCLRICVFPLANTSFKSFAKLRKVSPQMYELRETYKDDKQKLQEELVKLYQKEKVNPMAGCLPILVQIPIFFALYKVLSNTIEMRQAPFFGWIQDLSAPDPTTIFNLFGLIHWDPPRMLMIGAWPCFMLVSMLIQKTLNPPPQDKTQAQMMAAMPWVMTYVLAQFASGLVIYWTFNNLLSTIQQYIIMKSMGVEPHIFKKDKAEEKLEEAVEKGPAVHPSLEMIEDKVEEALFGDEPTPPDITPPKPKKKKKKK